MDDISSWRAKGSFEVTPYLQLANVRHPSLPISKLSRAFRPQARKRTRKSAHNFLLKRKEVVSFEEEWRWRVGGTTFYPSISTIYSGDWNKARFTTRRALRRYRLNRAQPSPLINYCKIGLPEKKKAIADNEIKGTRRER